MFTSQRTWPPQHFLMRAEPRRAQGRRQWEPRVGPPERRGQAKTGAAPLPAAAPPAGLPPCSGRHCFSASWQGLSMRPRSPARPPAAGRAGGRAGARRRHFFFLEAVVQALVSLCGTGTSEPVRYTRSLASWIPSIPLPDAPLHATRIAFLIGSVDIVATGVNPVAARSPKVLQSARLRVHPHYIAPVPQHIHPHREARARS